MESPILLDLERRVANSNSNGTNVKPGYSPNNVFTDAKENSADGSDFDVSGDGESLKKEPPVSLEDSYNISGILHEKKLVNIEGSCFITKCNSLNGNNHLFLLLAIPIDSNRYRFTLTFNNEAVCFIHHLRFEFSTTQSDDDDNISVMLFYFYRDKQTQPETTVIDLDNVILSSSRNFDESEEFSPEEKDIDQIFRGNKDAGSLDDDHDDQPKDLLHEFDEEDDNDNDDDDDDDDGFLTSEISRKSSSRPTHSRRPDSTGFVSKHNRDKQHLLQPDNMKNSDSSLSNSVSYLIRSVGIADKIAILFQSSHPVIIAFYHSTTVYSF